MQRIQILHFHSGEIIYGNNANKRERKYSVFLLEKHYKRENVFK